jgi:hypothetical protein
MSQFKLEYVQILPEFDGQRSLLPEFIKTAETLIKHFYDHKDPNDFSNILLIKAIKNKVKGEAATHIASYEISNWADLKTALLATYADKRDLPTLNMELCELKQGKLKPLEFFSRVQDNLNLQVAYIKTHHGTDSAILINYSQKLALRVFLKNLNSPLGDYISTRNPDTLNTALHILTNDFNITDRLNTPQENKFRPPIQRFSRPFPQTQQSTPNYFSEPFPRTQQPTPNYSPNFVPKPPPNFTFNQNVPRQTDRPNVPKRPYVPSTIRTNQGQTPMSISTRDTIPYKFPRGNFNLTDHKEIESEANDPNRDPYCQDVESMDLIDETQESGDESHFHFLDQMASE